MSSSAVRGADVLRQTMEQLIAARNELKDVKTQLEDSKTQLVLTDLRCKHAEAVRDEVQERCDQLVEELAKAKEECKFARNEMRRLEDEFATSKRLLKRKLGIDFAKLRSEEVEEIAFVTGSEPENLYIDDKNRLRSQDHIESEHDTLLKNPSLTTPAPPPSTFDPIGGAPIRRGRRKRGPGLQKPSCTRSEQTNMKAEVRNDGLNESPIILMTVNIVDFYHRCNANYSYSKALNPRRVLTRPNLGVFNSGRDNEAHDLIVSGSEALHGNTKRRYVALEVVRKDILGQYLRCEEEVERNYVLMIVTKAYPDYAAWNQVPWSFSAVMSGHFFESTRSAHVQFKPLKDAFVCDGHLCLVYDYNISSVVQDNREA